MKKGRVKAPREPTSQEIEKARSEGLILNALENGAMRWKDLKAKMKTTVKSTRTLSNHLQELQKNGMVRRIVDTSVYPPAVSYELSSTAPVVKAVLDGKAQAVAILLRQLEREMRENRDMLNYFIDSDTPAEDVLIHYFEDYFTDFLFLLNEGFEQPEMFPYIVFNMKELYAARMANLFEYWQKKPEMKVAVKKAFNDLRVEQKKDIDAFLDKHSAPFQDKPLAKAIIKLYLAEIVLNHEKGTAYDFLKRLLEDKTLREKLERQFGEPIEQKRIEKTFEEPMWKTLNAKSK